MSEFGGVAVFFGLNRRPAGEAHFFGEIAQQTTEGRVGPGVELECDRREVAVVEQRPQLSKSLASYSEKIDASREALGIDGSRAATGDDWIVLMLLLLVGIWCGSAVAETGRTRSIASGGGQRVRLLVMMTRYPVVLRDRTVACRRGGGGLAADRGDLVDRLAEAAGAGDHLPASHR